MLDASHAANEFRNPTKGVAQLNSAKRAFFFNGRLYDVLPRSRTLVIDVRQLHNERTWKSLKKKGSTEKKHKRYLGENIHSNFSTDGEVRVKITTFLEEQKTNNG
ncbi:hypothetical protein TNCV_302731 [Trichonephila clavipes]|nr:hypothetical protein TNCV_302731 [Trichonephila clavipes]